jgi:polar amino acid transport system substrate-binding protein
MVRPERLGKGVEQLKTLALVQGFTPWDYMDLVRAKKITVTELADYPNLMEFVIRGRCDGAYGSVICARFELNKRKPGANELVYDPSLPHSRDFYKMSSVKNPGFIADFNRWLESNAERVQQMKKDAGVILE